MPDLIAVVAWVALFGLSVLYVNGLDRLKGTRP